MKEIKTEVLIDASAEKVWRILMDFENYPRWNPFIKSIKGEKAVGEKITVSLKPPGGGAMTFRPVILKLEPAREFRWKGKLGIKGLFDGEHFFILEKISDRQTRFIHGEHFGGLLTGMLGNVLHKTEEGFRQMNEALKRECEK